MGLFMGVDYAWDNGGRRCVLDRREFSYTGYMPERRSGRDRRSGVDRRRKVRESGAGGGVLPFMKEFVFSAS